MVVLEPPTQPTPTGTTRFTYKILSLQSVMIELYRVGVQLWDYIGLNWCILEIMTELMTARKLQKKLRAENLICNYFVIRILGPRQLSDTMTCSNQIKLALFNTADSSRTSGHPIRHQSDPLKFAQFLLVPPPFPSSLSTCPSHLNLTGKTGV